MKPASPITSTGFYRRWTLFATAHLELAMRWMRRLLSLRYANAVYASEPDCSMTGPDRSDRALAIALASMSFRGEVVDIERLLGLADEYLQYIQGDDGAMIPRPDKAVKGRLPKP